MTFVLRPYYFQTDVIWTLPFWRLIGYAFRGRHRPLCVHRSRK